MNNTRISLHGCLYIFDMVTYFKDCVFGTTSMTWDLPHQSDKYYKGQYAQNMSNFKALVLRKNWQNNENIALSLCVDIKQKTGCSILFPAFSER